LIYIPYLFTTATLPWETSQGHNDNFHSCQPELHITVAQSKTTSSLSAQPVQVQLTIANV